MNRLSRVHERYRQTDDRRQTDRQTTDGRAISYSEREREFTFAKNIVAYRKSKRFKPTLGNSNVHRRRNFDRERSAPEIVSYRARVKYDCARIHCTCFTYYRIRGEFRECNPVTYLFLLK